jgi:3-oxoadipate enol-lactonase
MDFGRWFEPMPFATLKSRDFYFERTGSGERLLLISGTGGDLRRPETRFEGPLTRHFEVLAYDQRGLGQSYKGDEGAVFTIADYADDAALLMDALGWDRAHVVGISFGGMVAQEFVLRHPGKVQRLILCCTAAGGAGGSSFPFHTLPEMSAAELAGLKIKISDARHDEVWAKANPALYRQLLALASADPFAGEPGHREGALRQLAARAGHDSWDRLPAISCPVLVAGGCHDGTAKPEVVTALAARIPGARLSLFNGGHLFMLEDKSAYPAMMGFLHA